MVEAPDELSIKIAKDLEGRRIGIIGWLFSP
jgi:hypothetical protein